MKWIKKNSVEIVLGLGLISFLTTYFGEEFLVPVALLVIGLIMLYRRHFRMRHTDSSIFFESMYDDRDEDDLYEDAKNAVIEAGKASTSYLQRKLRIGYSRAARLMDLLEENNVIGSQNGSAPREVLKNTDEKQEDQQ
jgi:DNA segregation ATPase FtsK/SpoIIIE-like protein